MTLSAWRQEGYAVRFDWGPEGATALATDAGVSVVVDVLSFTTSVSVLVERGTAVYPAAWRDERAADLASEVDAVLASGRRQSRADRPWSLSPAGLRAAPTVERLVLPSPNGSAIAAAAAGPVVAACLRNASAVARWLADRSPSPAAPVNVVAAGERWPDGSLRPCLEDLLGAGAVLSAFTDLMSDPSARPSAARPEDRPSPEPPSGSDAPVSPGPLSPEAVAAATLFRHTPDPADAVRRCASGLELADGGYAADVEVAIELDSSASVPLLTPAGFFAEASRRAP